MADMCPIGFGTWLIKRNDAKNIVNEAFSAGYTHFDLAWFYKNEKEIGEAFKEQFEDKKLVRSKYFIITKIWDTNHQPAKLRKQVEEQLKYINLGYFDLIVVHWPIHEKFPGDGIINKGFTADFDHCYGMKDVWRAMEDLVAEGKCKHIGLSNFPVASILDILSYCKIKPFCNQVEINIQFQNTQLIDWCLNQNIKIVAYRPLGGQDSIAKLSNAEKLKETAKKYGQSEANQCFAGTKKVSDERLRVVSKTSKPECMRPTFSPFWALRSSSALNGLDPAGAAPTATSPSSLSFAFLHIRKCTQKLGRITKSKTWILTWQARHTPLQ